MDPELPVIERRNDPVGNPPDNQKNDLGPSIGRLLIAPGGVYRDHPQSA